MNIKLTGAILLTVGAGVSVAGLGCGGGTSSGSGGTGTTSTTSATGTSSSTKAATSTGTGSTGSGTSTGSGGDCQTTCESMHMPGFKVLSQAVVQACGCKSGQPCTTKCMGDMVCTSGMGLPMSGSACDMCIQAEGAKGQGSSCAPGAAFGPTCQGDTDCKALVNCIIGCMGG